jgi:hypothetical protein
MNAPVRKFEITRRVPFSPSYCVSESGRVGRIGTTAWLRQFPAKRGNYLTVSLWEKNIGKTWPVHQIVAITFHGPRPSSQHEVAHRDGRKPNNHWRNLRWATRVENEHDKVAHGRTNRGERNGQAKLSDNQAREIVAAYASGETQRSIASRYAIDQSQVSNIVRGKRRF